MCFKKLYKLRHCYVCLLAYFLITTPVSSVVNAEVKTSIVLSGGSFLAPDGNGYVNISGGTQEGGNLFYNFDKFSIGSGDVAYFQNTAGSSVENIINYVTGEKSNIDGEINTREFGAANLFLINPQGIVFGENAILEVGGSFYVSTADTLRFEDGSVLDAGSVDQGSLSSAPVVAFGFLDATAAEVTVDGAILNVTEGQDLTIIGGNIVIGNEAEIEVSGGDIKFISQVDSAGEAKLDLFASGSSEFTSLGEVAIQSGAVVGGDGSSVFVLSDALKVEGSGSIIEVYSGGRVDIDLSGDLKVLDGGGIYTYASGGETAANINITVRQGGVLVSGMSEGRRSVRSTINSSASGGGIAGNVSVITKESNIHITDGGMIEAVSSGFGEQSAAGDITLVADELIIDQGGQVLNSASGDGIGGVITINTNTINITDDITDPEPSIQSETTGSGVAGNIVIQPLEKNLVIKGNGTISADSASRATGNAGNINIETPEGDLLIADGINISAKTSSQGLGGGITVNGKNVNISNGVSLTAESLFVQESLPTDSDNSDFGKSGSISVTASERLVMDNSNINLNTQEADAGNIVIRAGRLFRMDNQSKITTSVADGNGDGGDILINEKIDSNLVVLSNKSEIRANARQGAGGNIDIKAYSHLISPDSIIDASAGPAGIDGAVTVTTPDVDATTGMLQLPESFLDVSALLGNRCAMRTASNSSSFLISANRDESTPDDLLVSHPQKLDDVSKNSVLEQIAMRCW